jgi:RNA polymerase sigma-70 factor (ECF subfamily)
MVGQSCENAGQIAFLHPRIAASFLNVFAFWQSQTGPQKRMKTGRYIPKTTMDDCRTDLPQEVTVKASRHELELIRRSQSGDTEAFGELVTKYRTKIFNTIYGIAGNESDAWDLAQEGFLKAWRSIHRFQGRSSFYTWLYRITINVTIDSLRRRCHQREVELDDAIPSLLPGPGVNYERVEMREQVYAALAQLTPEHRAVIILKEIDDLHYQEIADILDLSLGTVMSRLFYGRRKLQSILRPIFRPAKVEKEKPRFSCNAAITLP